MRALEQGEATEAAGSRVDLDAVARRRVLVVVAHPDDEVLGCGVLLSRIAEVRVLHITDGAPRDGADARRHGFSDWSAYAEARWREAGAALALAGVPASRRTGFGIADQGTAFSLAAVARRLAPLASEADVVLTHAFEGGHPDHDAAAYAVHAAVRLLRGPGHRPSIVEMPFYHCGPDGWVRQRFLAHPGAGPETLLQPSQAEQRLKQRMAEAHRTQAAVLADFTLGTERFRVAPDYDFAVLPNRGRLLYERHNWNLTGEQWIDCVTRADADLGRGQPA